MTTVPQPGLFMEETAVHYHLELSLPDELNLAQTTTAIAKARQAATSMRGPNTVWGFSPRVWRALAPQNYPDLLEPFTGVAGLGGHNAPATQSDIWFWCHGNAYEKVWRAAYDVLESLRTVARLDAQLSAYVGGDDRDSIGFIDGTENPALDEALQVAVIPTGQPGEGGSPVLVQKWVHDLTAFEDLSLSQQEDVIGRTRGDSTELDEAVMPATSHVSRNVIEDDSGKELHIFRRNTPFASVGAITAVGVPKSEGEAASAMIAGLEASGEAGSPPAGEIGTLFIGCSADPGRIDTMLSRMFGTSGDGLIDHLIKYSTPVTGAYYFAPAMDHLTDVFGPLESVAGSDG
jgi:putative iron-dependent peroxidase